MGISRYTLLLLQEAYPEQIRIEKYLTKDKTIDVEVFLLNENKEPHMTLFTGKGFKNEEDINDTIQKLLNTKID